jgi:hypothetical protein
MNFNETLEWLTCLGNNWRLPTEEECIAAGMDSGIHDCTQIWVATDSDKEQNFHWAFCRQTNGVLLWRTESCITGVAVKNDK